MSEAAPASEAAGSEAPKSEAEPEPEPVSEAGEPKSEAVSEAPKSEAHRFKKPLRGGPKYSKFSAKLQFLKPRHPRAHLHLRALHLAKVSK